MPAPSESSEVSPPGATAAGPETAPIEPREPGLELDCLLLVPVQEPGRRAA